MEDLGQFKQITTGQMKTEPHKIAAIMETRTEYS